MTAPTLETAHTVHAFFDLLAAVSAVIVWRIQRPLLPPGTPVVSDAAFGHGAFGRGYLLAVVLGALTMAHVLGTLNLWVSGIHLIGRSIAGGLAGAVIAVELYKRWHKISGSTGLAFVLPLCALVVVGRVGCFLAGLHDETHGAPTGLGFGWDYGDGILRWPVQAMESLDMLVFALGFTWLLARRRPLVMVAGFPLMVGWYFAQRFGLEFLKPYGTLIGPFNLFHLLCAGMIGYAVVLVRRYRSNDAATS